LETARPIPAVLAAAAISEAHRCIGPGETAAYRQITETHMLDAPAFGKQAAVGLFPRRMSTLLVLLHDGARGDFFGTSAVAARLLRAFFDVFVLALLLVAHAA
jgi:hypothetical protein